MLTPRRLVFVATGVMLSIVVGAHHGDAAQQKKSKVDYKVTIYDDEELRGKNVIVRQSTPDMEQLKFNDRSESLAWHIAPGRAAVLCDDKNFNRPVLVLVGEGEVRDLGKQQPNALHSISSIIFAACKKGAYPRGVSRDVPKVGTEE
jgi:hypothetical protein